MTAPVIAQAKAALNKNLAVTQSNLAKCKYERGLLRSELNRALMQVEMSERAFRDVGRDRDKWRERALKAEATAQAVGVVGKSPDSAGVDK